MISFTTVETASNSSFSGSTGVDGSCKCPLGLPPSIGPCTTASLSISLPFIPQLPRHSRVSPHGSRREQGRFSAVSLRDSMADCGSTSATPFCSSSFAASVSPCAFTAWWDALPPGGTCANIRLAPSTPSNAAIGFSKRQLGQSSNLWHRLLVHSLSPYVA